MNESAIWYEVSTRARAIVARAVQAGVLPPARSLQCADCGKPAHGYDHRDYRKPIDVQPVCRSCNAFRGKAAPVREEDIRALIEWRAAWSKTLQPHSKPKPRAKFKPYRARIIDGVPSAGALVEVRGEVRTRTHPDHLHVVVLTDTTDSAGRPIRAGADCIAERAHVQPAIPEPAKVG